MPSQSPSMRLLGRLPSLNLDDDELRRSRSSKFVFARFQSYVRYKTILKILLIRCLRKNSGISNNEYIF